MIETVRKPPPPDTSQRLATLRWLGCLVLLALEFAYLSDLSSEARWLIFRTIRIPVIKMAWLVIAIGVAVVLYRRRLPELPARSGFGAALLFHAAAAVTVGIGLERFFAYSLRVSVWESVLAWLLMVMWFGLSWLNCLVSPRYWGYYFRQYGGFVAGAVALHALLERVRGFSFSQTMVNGSIDLACWALDLIGLRAVQDKSSSMMGLSGFQVKVGYHCSGWEGIALIFVFLTIYLVVRRHELSFPSALIILPVAVALSWVLNSFRIAALLVLGAYISPDLALDAFHSRAGWVAFVFIGLVFVTVIEHFKLFHQERDQSQEFPSLPFLAPLGTQLFLTLIFAAFVVDVDIFYPARTLLVVGVLFCFVSEYSRLKLWAPPEISALLLGIVVYLFWVPMVGYEPTDDPRGLLPESVANLWLLSRLLGSVFVVPVIEELAFRGYLLRRFQAQDFRAVPETSCTLTSVLVSALAFGALHQAWFAGFLAGLVYAYAYTSRGKLSDAIVAHAVTNLCIAVHVVARGRWDLW